MTQTAWVLSTDPDPSIRNGEVAVGLAEEAARLTGGQEPAVLDALAAAYAESGRFTEAVATAERALALSRGQGSPELAAGLDARVSLYRTRSPYRESR
jgi:Flp pilus assembly protein TadD